MQKDKQMEEKNLTEKRNITPQMAVKILRKNGIEVDEKKAEEILDFLYLWAKLTVKQYLKE